MDAIKQSLEQCISNIEQELNNLRNNPLTGNNGLNYNIPLFINNQYFDNILADLKKQYMKLEFISTTFQHILIFILNKNYSWNDVDVLKAFLDKKMVHEKSILTNIRNIINLPKHSPIAIVDDDYDRMIVINNSKEFREDKNLLNALFTSFHIVNLPVEVVLSTSVNDAFHSEIHCEYANPQLKYDDALNYIIYCKSNCDDDNFINEISATMENMQIRKYHNYTFEKYSDSNLVEYYYNINKVEKEKYVLNIHRLVPFIGAIELSSDYHNRVCDTIVTTLKHEHTDKVDGIYLINNI